MKDWTGQQIGTYQVLRLLKQGPVVDHYLSHGPSAHRLITLFLLAAPTDEAGMFRFQRHLPIIKRLVHPHIAPLLDAGVQDMTPFVALDHLPTSREVHQPPLPISTVIRYVSQLAAALEYAHNQGVLHAYTTPETIFVSHHHEVLLAGFGLFLLQMSQKLQGPQKLPVPLTYLSPEQVTHNGSEQRALDQYGLATMVYEWLCGAPPFPGAQSLQTLIQIIKTPPPPLREKAPMLPLALEQVIMKALAKEPGERFVTIQAFCHALKEASRDRC